MQNSNKRNDYRKTGDHLTLTVTRRNGSTYDVLVDNEDVPTLQRYWWRVIHNKGKRPVFYNDIAGTVGQCVTGASIPATVLSIDGNNLNCRKANLEIKSPVERALKHWHQKRLGPVREDNIFQKKTGEYEVAFSRDTVRYYVGVWKSLDDAVIARDAWQAGFEAKRVKLKGFSGSVDEIRESMRGSM